MRLNKEDLATIKSLRQVSDARGILSVYLPIEPGRGTHHGHAPRLMDELKQLSGTAAQGSAARIEEESQRVLTYVRDEFTPHGSGLVLFSGTPSGLWHAITVQLPVPALARFGPRPYLGPLDALLEDYPSAVAVVADHKEARILTLKLGEFERQDRLTSDVPGRQRQGGWAAFKYERDRQHHIETFLAHIVETLTHLDRDEPFEYLLLGGTDETTHALSNLLPAVLQAKLAGTFRSELFATDSDIVDNARPLIAAAERRQERALVQGLIDLALDGGQAALGVDETLQTLREGRAHSLVIAADTYDTPNGELAVSLAEKSDAPVEVAHDEAQALLAPYGGLAARLRY